MSHTACSNVHRDYPASFFIPCFGYGRDAMKDVSLSDLSPCEDIYFLLLTNVHYGDSHDEVI